MNSISTIKDEATGLLLPAEDASREVKRRMRRPFFAWLTILVIAIAAVIASPYLSSWIPGTAVMGVCFAAGALFLFLIYVYFSAGRRFIVQFAAANNFTFKNHEKPRKEPGTLFRVGHSRRMRNIVAGTYAATPFRFFSYTFTKGSGKSQANFAYSVFTIQTPAKLPSIFLANKKHRNFANNIFLVLELFGPFQGAHAPKKVGLEEGWSDTLELRAPEDYEIEALQLFNGKVCTALKDYFLETRLAATIEFADDQLYIYVEGAADTAAKLSAIYSLAALIITECLPELQKMRGGLEAQREIFAGK